MIPKSRRKPLHALRSWRIMSKLTSVEAGMLFGVSGKGFLRWETGETNVPQHQVPKLMELTGLPRQVLLHERGRAPIFALTPFKKPKGGRDAFFKMIEENLTKSAQSDDPRALAWEAAKLALGAESKIAELLNVTPQEVAHWHVAPVGQCAILSKLTGIPRSTLRPDFFWHKDHATNGGSPTQAQEIDEGPSVQELSTSHETAEEQLTVSIDALGVTARLSLSGNISDILGNTLAKAYKLTSIHGQPNESAVIQTLEAFGRKVLNQARPEPISPRVG